MLKALQYFSLNYYLYHIFMYVYTIHTTKNSSYEVFPVVSPGGGWHLLFLLLGMSILKISQAIMLAGFRDQRCWSVFPFPQFLGYTDIPHVWDIAKFWPENCLDDVMPGDLPVRGDIGSMCVDSTGQPDYTSLYVAWNAFHHWAGFSRCYWQNGSKHHWAKTW